MTAASKICDAAKLFLHVLLAANVSTEVDTVLEEREGRRTRTQSISHPRLLAHIPMKLSSSVFLEKRSIRM
jgi:hypothetical protein